MVPEATAGGVDAPPQPPSASQLLAVAVTKGLPFVAFGFVDNVIMVSGCGWDRDWDRIAIKVTRVWLR
jgi:hypothetical protein